MAQFRAFSPNVEVNGETVLSIVDGMGAFKPRAMKILEENGIKEPRAGQWYRQQSWLDAFKAIAESLGGTTLFAIGKKIPENAQFPPQINQVEAALAAIDVAYHMNHRGGEIGAYKFEKTGANTGKMVCPNPYPCEFDRGIVEAMAKKFAPKAFAVKVEHDDSCPCRKKGADSCTYKVTW